jgi:transcriptional regulator with PAS, ATPase and Fis domain
MESLLIKYGRFLLFLEVAVEGEAFLLAGAFLVHRGYFNLGPIVLVAALSNFVADSVYCLLARARGLEWLDQSFIGNQRYQRVETADGGTLFLDEIGELPLDLQIKLLRLIQQGEIEKIGASNSSKVDVQIIAATHRNLQAMIEDGAFREDLYYRLAVIPLELQPLRERLEDDPELVLHLFLKSKQKHGRTELQLPESLLPGFSNYDWPGNIRALENIIERLVVLEVGNKISADDLPEFLRRGGPLPDIIRLDLSPNGISLEVVEKDLITKALKKFSWNQTQAAKYLDISRRTLNCRMEKHCIRKDPVENGGAQLDEKKFP